MADWDVRRAELADVALLVACIDAAYAIYAARGIGLPAVSDGIADDIQDNIVWAAVQNAKMIGAHRQTIPCHARERGCRPDCNGARIGAGLNPSC